MHYGTYHFDFSMYTGVMLYSSSLEINYTNIIPLKIILNHWSYWMIGNYMHLLTHY